MASCRSKPAITRESGASRGEGMDQCYFSWRSRHFFTKKLGERKFCVNSTNFAHCLLVKIMTQKKSTGMHPGPKLCEKKKPF
jgi:hypothetical protein